jgi:DDE domain
MGLEVRTVVRPRTSPRTSAATSTWHLDEMAVVISGQQFWLWRAVDDEGEVLDLLVQRRRVKAAAVKFMRKLLKKQGFAPNVWLPTGCALTARQRPKSACRLATSGAYARTIGLRIRINRLDDASGRCSVSNRPDQLNASCLFTPPSKTRSTSNAISHPAARSASSATRRSGRGEPPPRLEPELRLPIFTRPNLVRVTAPSRQSKTGDGRGDNHQREDDKDQVDDAATGS